MKGLASTEVLSLSSPSLSLSLSLSCLFNIFSCEVSKLDWTKHPSNVHYQSYMQAQSEGTAQCAVYMEAVYENISQGPGRPKHNINTMSVFHHKFYGRLGEGRMKAIMYF